MGEKSDLAREKILSEFYHLLCRQGYKHSSLRQLSDICGMSTGHINFYFKKKEELAIGVLDIYLARSYAIISEYGCLSKDELTLFLLHQALLCYLTDKRKTTYRIISEFIDNKEFLAWRAQQAYSYARPALHAVGFTTSDNDLKDACVGAIYGIYAISHKRYTERLPFDYQRSFRLFMRILFAQIGFTQADAYIEKTLQLFEGLDKEALIEQFNFMFHYE